MSSHCSPAKQDIFCITETWLNSRVLDNEFVPQGYTVYRAYRRGGGVLIAVCNNIRSKLVTNHPDAEIITIELCISPKNFIYPVSMSHQIAPKFITTIF